MIERISTISANAHRVALMWKVGETRFIKPHHEEKDSKGKRIKPEIQYKVLGGGNLWYKGTELDCDIYEGNITYGLKEDDDPPNLIVDYVTYYRKSAEILAKIRSHLDEVIQESRRISETPEESEESDSISGSPETESE